MRDALAKDLMGTVAPSPSSRYQIVEFYSALLLVDAFPGGDVRKLLDDLGIQCRSTHNDNRVFTPEGDPEAIELNQIIGSKYVVMASPGGCPPPTAGSRWPTG